MSRSNLPEARGVQVEISLDAPQDSAGEVIAQVLENTVNRHLHRAFTKAGATHIAAAADRIVEMRPESGSYWTSANQHSLAEDVLSEFLTRLQIDVTRELRARLLLELAAMVAPRISPKGPHS